MKPRSSAPARQASETRSSSAMVSSSTSASVSIGKREPGLLDPGHRLAHLANRTALEREPRRLDDRLVTEVEPPESECLEGGRRRGTDRDRPEPEPARTRERGRLREERGHGRLGPDRVAGTEQHAALDAIAEERGAVVAEEVLLVAPELEEGEGVVAVPADDLADRLPHLRVGKRTGGGKRPEDEPGDRAECDEARAGR